MAKNAGLSVEAAVEVVDCAVAVVERFSILKKPPLGVTAPVRNRVGERDGWVYQICGDRVDPALKYLQSSPVETRTYAEYLAWFGRRRSFLPQRLRRPRGSRCAG